MKDREVQVKKKIIRTTFDLLMEYDAEEITTRKIAKAAGVSVSAINYHFQTKNNLIEIAIRDTIGDIVGMMKELYKSIEGSPYSRLLVAVKETCNFIAKMPRVSRISIFSDLMSGYGEDNIKRSSDVLRYILKEVFNGEEFRQITDSDINILIYQIVGAIDFAFLRSKQIKAETGLDFFNDADRNYYVVSILNNLIKIRGVK